MDIGMVMTATGPLPTANGEIRRRGEDPGKTSLPPSTYKAYVQIRQERPQRAKENGKMSPGAVITGNLLLEIRQPAEPALDVDYTACCRGHGCDFVISPDRKKHACAIEHVNTPLRTQYCFRNIRETENVPI
jgi:hypothetical protein